MGREGGENVVHRDPRDITPSEADFIQANLQPGELSALDPLPSDVELSPEAAAEVALDEDLDAAFAKLQKGTAPSPEELN